MCSSGQYQRKTEQTTCIDCPAGTVRYSNTVDGTSWNGATNNDIANAKADCKVCPSGRYQNEAGTTDCKHCPAGAVRAADSAKDNQFWDGQTSSSNMFVADEKADCKVCSSGQYQHQTEQTTCIDCPAGTVRYSDTVDGTSWDGQTNNDIAVHADCRVCASGMYQNEEGSGECKNCPSGSVREIHVNDDKVWDGIIGGLEHKTNEASDCLVCASGKYQEEHGMTSCKSCPIGTIRPPASGKDGMPWDAIGKENFIFLVSVGQKCSDFRGIMTWNRQIAACALHCH